MPKIGEENSLISPASESDKFPSESYQLLFDNAQNQKKNEINWSLISLKIPLLKKPYFCDYFDLFPSFEKNLLAYIAGAGFRNDFTIFESLIGKGFYNEIKTAEVANTIKENNILEIEREILNIEFGNTKMQELFKSNLISPENNQNEKNIDLNSSEKQPCLFKEIVDKERSKNGITKYANALKDRNSLEIQAKSESVKLIR